MVYGELGRYPFEIMIKKRMIGYWARLIVGKETKLSKIVYDCLYSLFNKGIYVSKWLKCIKDTLDKCGGWVCHIFGLIKNS